MKISMYDTTIPVWKHYLNNLSIMLDKTAVYSDAKKIDHAVILNARLYPDMFGLTRQVQMASDYAKNASARLAGIDLPKVKDDESNFAQLQARISKTISFLDSIMPSQLEGSESRDIVLFIHEKMQHMNGMQYVQYVVQPNFYFHITTAYNIMYHNGLGLSDEDFGFDDSRRKELMGTEV